MKDALKRALAAKGAQRAKSKGKSIAEKLATVERMRERRQLMSRARKPSGDTKPARR